MWRTIDLVPSSIRGDPQVISACEAIDVELEAIYGCMAAVPGGILFWPFINEQVPPMLDVMGWEMHVDVWQGWDGELSIEEKRTLIDESIYFHQHKGTKWAVEWILKTVFRSGYVLEWYQYGGDPYYFKIITEEEIVDPERLERVIEGIYAVKNIRSWLDGFVRSKASRLQLYVGIHCANTYVQRYVPAYANKPFPIP